MSIKLLLQPLFSALSALGSALLLLVLALFAVFVISFFVCCRLNPFRLTPDKLRAAECAFKWHDLFRWLIVDFMERKERAAEFKEYGFTFYVGRQGAGKTISMIEYLERMRKQYPDCIIVTNFGYKHATHYMESWRDIMEVRNGTKGVIFAIDEIHSEYSSASWKDIPESLLSEISQQRKQRIKIVATAQFFTRVAKPLREQAFSVVVCKTMFGRLTSWEEFDSIEYSDYVDCTQAQKKKLKPLRSSSFVQSDALRDVYDTYEKIERMKKLDFIPRDQRGH